MNLIFKLYSQLYIVDDKYILVSLGTLFKVIYYSSKCSFIFGNISKILSSVLKSLDEANKILGTFVCVYLSHLPSMR